MKHRSRVMIATAGLALVSQAALALTWRYEEDVDKFTDKKMAAIFVRAETTMLYPQRRPPREGPKAQLQILCREGKLHVMYVIKGELVGGSRTSIIYRADGRPAVNARWLASADSTAVGVWDTPGVRRFIGQVEGADKLMVRTTHDVFGSTESEFLIGQLKTAKEPVLKHCGVK
jgi:hypothetical protein